MQHSPKNRLDEKLKKFGIFVGYALFGFAATAYFSFKVIMLKYSTFHLQTKSTLKFNHLMYGAGIFVVVYACGFYYVIKSQLTGYKNLETEEAEILSADKRCNADMQEHYIFKTMKFFRVSEGLIEKTKKQFQEMAKKQGIVANSSGNRGSQSFKKILEWIKI